jgi:hypothetical protein
MVIYFSYSVRHSLENKSKNYKVFADDLSKDTGEEMVVYDQRFKEYHF